MSYKWETQHSSPNYTPGNRSQAVFGRPRTIEAIAIHWWGDPAQNPSYEGVVSYLCRPGIGASAHIVATGTGRRAACLVNMSDVSWATNSANPYTISIECDPRARDSDYDVVAEIIAQLRSIYGNIPLVPHNQFIATACPGVYNLSRLNQIAATKQVSKADAWGNVRNKSTPAPAPKPPAVKEKSRVVYSPLKKFKFNKDSKLYDLLVYKVNAKSRTYKKGEGIDIKQLLTLTNGNKWYRTKYSSDNELATGFRAEDLDEVVTPTPAPKPTPPPTPKPTPVPTPAPEKPVEEPESPSRVGLDESSTTLLQDIKRLLEELTQLLKSIFKTGDK